MLKADSLRRCESDFVTVHAFIGNPVLLDKYFYRISTSDAFEGLCNPSYREPNML